MWDSDSGEEEHTPTFATTHWSVVLAAGHNDTPESSVALEQLCRTYRYPLYAHVRRRGYGVEDAQDLTQEFFARLLAKEWLGMATPKRGRFRTFLLAALDNFLANEWNRAHSQKRGRDYELVSWDLAAAERRYQAEPVDDLTPEKIMQKRWAEALLEQVLDRLRREYQDSGKGQFFELAKQLLWGEKTAVTQATLAAQLGLSEGAFKVAVHRFRRRFREVLRHKIAQTVECEAEIDSELRELIAALRG